MRNDQINKVVLICSTNNYNELGLVRSFGINGIRPYGIIICPKKEKSRDWLHLSKYWRKVFFVEDADYALKLLFDNFGQEKLKPVVITPIDYIVHMIDKEYDRYSSHFIIPNFNACNNGINSYANKFVQSRLTEDIGMKSLPTDIIDLDERVSYDFINSIGFPVLLKPVAGGEGRKDDITVCFSRDEYDNALKSFREKEYRRILCQKYLENRSEYVLFGAMCKECSLHSYTVIKNIRQWPHIYGVGSFAKIINDMRWNDISFEIFDKLIDRGYDGPIDIELFLDLDTDDIYVCEYNWRSGGRNFTSIGTGVYSAVLWYFAKTGQSIEDYKQINDIEGYTINEATDINNLICNDLTIKEWIRDLKKSCAYSLWCKKDLWPIFIPYISILKKYFSKK